MVLCVPERSFYFLEIKEAGHSSQIFCSGWVQVSCMLTSELLWINNHRSFEISIPSIMVLWENKSAIQLATNPTANKRTKHVDIDCHFIKHHIISGFLNLVYLPSQQQLVDVLTKALPSAWFHELISKLGILNLYLPTWGGVSQLVSC